MEGQCRPFGLRSKIFSAVCCARVPHLIHYLDDFLHRSVQEVTGNCSWGSCKTEGPAASVTFLGILIDTRNCQLRLPQEKFQHLRELIDRWQSIKVCKQKELQSFLGHLSYVASVVHPGRTFLRELFNLLSQAKSHHHHVRLNIKAMQG